MPSPTLAIPDALSAALRAMQLHGQVFCRSVFSAPWSVAFPPGPAYFHVVERGRCWVTGPDDRPRAEALEGDLVVLARGEGHRISSAAGGQAVPLDEVLRGHVSGTGTLRWGGGGAETRLICGTFRLEAPARDALVPLLPLVVHVPHREGTASEWLDFSVRALAAEVNEPSPGAELAVSRLVDLIFVHALRHWLAQQPHRAAGWLGAMRDPQVGAALGRMHADPGRAWTIDTLARASGMSRSAFASRFAALVGEAPLHHLARWRMQFAAALLRGGGLRAHEVAARVGYDSEAAFSRAFKRYTGHAPRVFRRLAESGDALVTRAGEGVLPASAPAGRRREHRPVDVAHS
jgi:AraC-like DNA-binding protein